MPDVFADGICMLLKDSLLLPHIALRHNYELITSAVTGTWIMFAF
jgi:hypothetical protein